MTARLSAMGLLLVVVLSSCAGASDPVLAPASTSAVESSVATTQPETMPRATSVEPDTTATPVAAATTCRGGITIGRTDVRASGNRHAPGAIDLLRVPVLTAELPASPTWVVPFVPADNPCAAHWYVTLDDGQAVMVDDAGQVTDAGTASVPPETSAGVVRGAHDELDQFENPLPDSRVVTFGRWMAALIEPTGRYGHGVLGDRIEAGAVEIVDTDSGQRTRIVADAPTVIEGLSPILLDVDQASDAVPEILVTLSNSNDGAWLALYNLDGTLRSRSEPIGQGNRWRNQLGGGWTGANGEYEIVDVRTPHLAGVTEFFRVAGDRLERVATITGYTSHSIGSRNLDMGILVDADEDKILEVVLPTRDLGSLAVIDRTGDDAVELGRIDLGGSLSTNIASQWLVGQAWVAVGTTDGRLLVFGDSNR